MLNLFGAKPSGNDVVVFDQELPKDEKDTKKGAKDVDKEAGDDASKKDEKDTPKKDKKSKKGEPVDPVALLAEIDEEIDAQKKKKGEDTPKPKKKAEADLPKIQMPDVDDEPDEDDCGCCKNMFEPCTESLADIIDLEDEEDMVSGDEIAALPVDATQALLLGEASPILKRIFVTLLAEDYCFRDFTMKMLLEIEELYPRFTAVLVDKSTGKKISPQEVAVRAQAYGVQPDVIARQVVVYIDPITGKPTDKTATKEQAEAFLASQRANKPSA